MATNVLDTLVGGVLPHVHIKKVILEKETPALDGDAPLGAYNQPGTGEHKVTLQMELYQRKDNILKKSWLADVDLKLDDGPDQVTSIFDCFNINIITVQSNKNLSFLRKSKPNQRIQDRFSIFLKNQFGGFNGAVPKKDKDYWRIMGGSPSTHTKATWDPFARLHRTNLHLSALVGMTATGYTGNPGLDIANGPIREEVYKGDVYYAIPYEYSFSWKDRLSSSELEDRKNPDGTLDNYWVGHVDQDENGNFFAPNLGIAAYVSLNLRDVLDIPPGMHQWRDALDMEGPISAEVVLRGGTVPQTREAFIDNDGREWRGPVHYHGPNVTGAVTGASLIEGIPSPDGYIGYMAGSEHHAGMNQPKLNVLEVPNALVYDMTDPIKQKAPAGLLDMDQTSNVKPHYELIEKELELIGGTLGVKYQKETIKDIYKDKKDNDSEYSSLYITRDLNSAARGMFYVDFKHLLLNNSHYLRYLNVEAMTTGAGKAGAGPFNTILNESSIVDLRLKRRRINPYTYHKGYKTHQEGTPYEEPVRLLACLKDDKGFKTQKTTYQHESSNFYEIGLDTTTAQHTRYFVFADQEVASFLAGEYQYETELEFYDGTAVFIRKKLARYIELKKQLDAYYARAASSMPFAISSQASVKKTNGQISDETHTKKLVYKPYYDNNYKTFLPEFTKLAMNDATGERLWHNDPGSPIWWTAVNAIYEYLRFFTPNAAEYLSEDGAVTALYTKFSTMLMPGPVVSGSPESVLLVIKLFNSMISQLYKILDSGRPKKAENSNILQEKSTPADNQALPNDFYGSKLTNTRGIIREDHSFDHPREIFKATANKNYYVDFLSMSTELFSSYGGVRAISVDYFRNRCLADLAKYTTYALANPLLISGKDERKADGGSIAPLLHPPGSGTPSQITQKNKDGTEDVLENQMYSFLTPSIIELSDSVGSSYQYRYSAFSAGIQAAVGGSILADDKNIYGEEFFNSEYMNSTLVSLANFVKNKNDLGHADLSSPVNQVLDLDTPGSDKSDFEINQKESYKSYFSKYNITVHEAAKHDEFFGKGSIREPGARLDPEPVPVHPLTSENHSDGTLVPNIFFRNFLGSRKAGKLGIPTGFTSYGNWNENLPNTFKFRVVADGFKEAGINPNFLRPSMKEVLEGNSPADNALKFFNFNMVAHIEKLAGHGNKAAITDMWQPLRKSDLNSQKRLFCRMKYYDTRLVGGVEHLPMIDQYFILTYDPDEVSVPAPTPSAPDVDLPGMIAFFESQNQLRLQEMGVMLDEGMTTLGPLKLPPIGPDPSPIEMTGGSAAAQAAAQNLGQGAQMQQSGMQQMGSGPGQGSGPGGSGPSGGGGGYP